MAYQKFLDVLTQLEEDQSLFESELGQELQGIQHENLIRLGGKMTKKLRSFAKLGQSYAETLQPDFLPKITEAIEEYEHLIMPPKVFGGFCPCLKPARDGPEYDKKFRATLAKVVSTLFVCQAVVIEDAGEKLNMDSMHFADYANRMNTLHTTLAAISSQGNEQAREGCRIELLKAVESVNRFMKSFDVDVQDFLRETERRLNSISDSLQARGEGGLSRKALIGFQSSLQEIMNTAASVSMKKSKESVGALENLKKSLEEIRLQELAAFDEMESRMRESGLMDLLARLKEDSETVFSDSNSKLRDGLKRWAQVRGLSVAKPVAEYKEINIPSISQSLSTEAVITLPHYDPEKMFNDTTTNIKKAFVKPGAVVENVFCKMDQGVNSIVTGVSGLGSLAKKGAIATVQPVEKFLGKEKVDSTHGNRAGHPVQPVPKNKGFLAGAGSFLNPLDL